MRNPNAVLDNLASKMEENYKYERLYRNFYNPEFYLQAYSEIYAKQGNMTKGTDGKTADGMSLEVINQLISRMKNESYNPNPVRRTYIPKKDGRKRPLGIPSFEDKLVQQVIKNLLESIYENRFKNSSHGYRPKRSCHTALNHIQNTFTGARWFIEGDIKGFFDNIDHHILINLLRKTISDEKFIRLIWKFLRAGYLEDWKFKKTYSGTPQGGIISPVLANIYLDELDKFMLNLEKNFNTKDNRKRTSEYRSIEGKLARRKQKLKELADNKGETNEINKLQSEVKALYTEQYLVKRIDPMDPNFKKIEYVRYADDFIIGLIGNKEDAQHIKEEIRNFLLSELKLELSEEKTLITNSKKPARFLGYDVVVSRSESTKRDKNRVKKRYFGMVCKLYVPQEAWVSKLFKYNAIRINQKTKVWEPMHRKGLTNQDELEILSKYNAEIRGIYNYYKLASNVSVLGKFYYFMQYSLYKTFANKYRCKMSEVLEKYKKNGLFQIEYETKKGTRTSFLVKGSFTKQSLEQKDNTDVDLVPQTHTTGRSSMISRLIAEKCEWCGTENVELEIHHVRKLKDLKGKKHWEKVMISRNRKTMALCAPGKGNNCHVRLHNGKLD